MNLQSVAPPPINLQTTLNAIPGNHVILLPNAPTFTIIGVTDAFLQTSLTAREQIVGKPLFEVFPDDPANEKATGVNNLRASLNNVVTQKVAHQMTNQRYDIINPQTGAFEIRVWAASNKPVLDAGGAIQCIIHTTEDVTEKVRMQEDIVVGAEKLQESESRFRRMVEQAPIPILLSRGEEVIIESLNEPMLRFMNKTSFDDVVGKAMVDALPELRDQEVLQIVKDVQKTGVPFKGYEQPIDIFINGKPERHYFELSYSPVIDEGKITGVLHVALDVSKQVKDRKKVEESEQALRSFILQAPIAIAILRTKDYVVEIVNGHALEFWGRTYDAVINRPLFDCLPELQTQGFREFFDGIYDSGVPVSLQEHPIAFMRNGKMDNFYFNFLYEVLYDANGKVNGLLAVGVDVTLQTMARMKIEEAVEERTRELAKTNKELQRSNQNLEEFAHAASHDLKEPVRKIHIFTSQLKDQLSSQLNEGQARAFSRIENATERMGNLIDDLLLYSHVNERPIEMESVDLNKKVQNVLEDLELDIQEKGAIITVEKLPVVKGYRRQLQQLFQNLITNALKYSKAEVPPCIDIAASKVTESERPYHRIAVTDNGIGFDQEYAEKIFQMFARLHGKAQYSGTGVGLAIVKKVVQNHNGFVRVESAVGKGSVFKIYLPV